MDRFSWVKCRGYNRHLLNLMSKLFCLDKRTRIGLDMMKKETKIKRITIKRERNEGDPCGIDEDYFGCKNK